MPNDQPLHGLRPRTAEAGARRGPGRSQRGSTDKGDELMAREPKHAAAAAADLPAVDPAAIDAAIRTLLTASDPTAPYASIQCGDGNGNTGAMIVIVKGYRMSRLMTETMRVMHAVAKDMFGLELE